MRRNIKAMFDNHSNWSKRWLMRLMQLSSLMIPMTLLMVGKSTLESSVGSLILFSFLVRQVINCQSDMNKWSINNNRHTAINVGLSISEMIFLGLYLMLTMQTPGQDSGPDSSITMIKCLFVFMTAVQQGARLAFDHHLDGKKDETITRYTRRIQQLEVLQAQRREIERLEAELARRQAQALVHRPQRQDRLIVEDAGNIPPIDGISC